MSKLWSFLVEILSRGVPKNTRWASVHFCKECHHHLTEDERYFSKAICPYCGNKTGYHVCGTIEKVARYRNGELETKENPQGYS